jgi:hypothetical protein
MRASRFWRFHNLPRYGADLAVHDIDLRKAIDEGVVRARGDGVWKLRVADGWRRRRAPVFDFCRRADRSKSRGRS